MNEEISRLIATLRRMPATFRTLLDGLPEVWTGADDGGHTWSPHRIVAHLIQGEEQDWIPRARIILEHGPARPFDPFDRHGELDAISGRPLGTLLDAFETARAGNLAALEALDPTPEDLERTGTHPELGPVTLRNLLSCWCAHDLVHLAQASRVMARSLADDVGPWRHPDYMPL